MLNANLLTVWDDPCFVQMVTTASRGELVTLPKRIAKNLLSADASCGRLGYPQEANIEQERTDFL